MNKKVLKRRIKFVLDPVYQYVRRASHRRSFLYTRYFDKLKVINNTILYESRDGKSITDSPYAIFKYLLHHPDYQDYKHIWSVNSLEDLTHVINPYRKFKNVTFVKRNSKEYIKKLATSKYVINNSTFQSFFTPKSDQVYINTWHGTPLKSMGFDIPGNPSASQNVVRNFLSADYLLSPNEHTTNMFLDSYKLRGIYNGEILQEGYPRIDLTYHSDPEQVKANLIELGVDIDPSKQTILYAPTWKGTNIAKAKNDMFQIMADMNYLQNQVGEAYNVLIKVHPYLYGTAMKYEEIRGLLIPDFIDTNELLSAVDLLITDYSSIFFDYLVTDKPILFYVWDYDDYNEERGRYLSDDELPGPTLFTVQEVVSAVQNIEKVSADYKDVYRQAKSQFTNHDDGKVTARVVEYIFKQTPASINVINPIEKNKMKILIYPGGLRNNGITTSFINLMDNVDFDRYDVSVFVNPTNSKEVLNNMAKVNKNARFLFRSGLPAYSFYEVYRDKFVHNRGAHSGFTKMLYPDKAYIRDCRRLFGRTQFDYVIDFSGYSLYWAKYILANDAKKKICYMHNNILADSERTINGSKPHRINLRGLFSVYDRFDKLVSVSTGTMELNKKNLSKYADESKFDYVMNSINPEKILRLAEEGDINQHQKISLHKGKADISNMIFKSPAIIDRAEEQFVWNRPSGVNGAKKLAPAKHYLNKEVTILREARTETNTYYKFSFDDRIIGWLDQECFKLLPDRILSQKEVNKLAVVSHVYGHDIWSSPFKTEGAVKISSAKEYKGMMVTVDIEARTHHGIYSRFLINGKIIGWIESSALSVLKETAVTGRLKTSVYQMVNYRKSRSFVTNRTLEEKNIYELAVISKPGNYAVWSKPYPNPGCKKVMDASELDNAKVIVTKSNRTVRGTYYLFFNDGKMIGWLDQNAFTIIEEPIIYTEKQVKKTADIRFRDGDVVWGRLPGSADAEEVADFQKYNDKTVTIDKEARTIDEVYYHFRYENEPIGWLNKRSFQNIKTLGIPQGSRFIPEPSMEHYNFITMGRLSPEKGQDNLIQAFARLHKDNNKTKLYILGEGPLRAELETLITELGVEDSIYLPGQVENPFRLMKKCDCFVLSSHYEGQPMVLLEAMTHGMKIIATDIVANRTVLEDGRYGLLVENSIDGLENGLRKIVKEEFDYKADVFVPSEYNDRAMGTFYKIFE
ncbi:CDP-glycerol glycerophosphotransferase family protein [Neobacillus mesonae]|uniref:CDP-glycerol glycerophosphotransferase family protein n=1 Tax=Neobacillus mesonae TaxID=1193713 RepID=UPI002E2318BE|nr:CDP-glycerol glycerophosphotransferase family protein [Neobacillus mesonae]MED4204488.1 CDP-glycerol glycerophosphotransferase family protein [Neobacillus mesonae]